ncbi:MAG: NADH-quinone oxidoreductase subunit L [FCB group bacterium]|jgi:NADH-quinone oxidoreductase subunit L|nr:NADH-quinone oxidoreductase subunit L [FCB group bacterium]
MEHELGFALSNAWLVPALPLISFVVVGLFIRPYSAKWAGIVATLAVMGSAVMAYAIAWQYFHLYHGEDHPAIVPWTIEWLRYQPGMSVVMGTLIDPISVLLMVVVTTVSALVHLYSNGYMKGDPGFGRFFTYLSLFTFSMLGLVLAPNIVQMYVFWELVGVSSFLLIGFYYQKPSAVAASKKAFIVTRFADLGFLIGVLTLGYYGYLSFPQLSPSIEPGLAGLSTSGLQPFDFAYINSPEFLAYFAPMQVAFFGFSLLTMAMVLVFMGAAGKSAMFPLHIWLPDAMEGPTPVSALIHAATMVVAGVYLVARLFPAFAASETALLLVMVVGTFTSLFAAVIGTTQDDIKRVLAFSTLSQLGYMMLALGVSTMAHPLGYTASMFHLFTHAFFKALLFLAAGAVIHAVHSNSIWDMGGLAKKMPITHLCFLTATLAIAGIPPLAGFFSKDEILAAALMNHHYVVFGVAMLVAGLTAFYMFRIYFVTFWGPHRGHGAEHAHEAPVLMWLPLAILAVLSAVAGFVPMSHYIHIGAPLEHEGINLAIAVPASLMAVLGIGVAFFLYAGMKATARAERLATALGVIYRTIKNKFYIDEVYLFVTHKIIFNYISRPIAWFDRHVVDGGVDLSGWMTRTTGYVLSLGQTGQVQVYGLWYTAGALFVLLIFWAALG